MVVFGVCLTFKQRLRSGRRFKKALTMSVGSGCVGRTRRAMASRGSWLSPERNHQSQPIASRSLLQKMVEFFRPRASLCITAAKTRAVSIQTTLNSLNTVFTHRCTKQERVLAVPSMAMPSGRTSGENAGFASEKKCVCEMAFHPGFLGAASTAKRIGVNLTPTVVSVIVQGSVSPRLSSS